MAAEMILADKSAAAKHMNLLVSCCTTACAYLPRYRYESNPINIDTTRWDPVSGGASAVMATATDMAGSITGMFTSPIEEYRDEQRRRAREAKRQAANSDAGSGNASVAGSASSSSSIKPETKQPSMAGKMAAASAKSIGGIAPTAAKGMLVDIPLAFAEGLKAIPGHYGDTVRDHGAVTDAKSGVVVAGKTFAWGFVDGLSDLVVQPYKGARKEGAVGAVKGIGKGVVGLTTKSGAGMFGLFAYPSAGVAKSLRSATHGGTRKKIAKARHAEGEWLLGTERASGVKSAEIVSAFRQWCEKS